MRLAAVCAMLSLAGAGGSAMAISSMTILSSLNGGASSTPLVMSADGSTIGGFSYNGIGQQATVWTGPGWSSREGLGSPGQTSIVSGVSADGSVRAGWMVFAPDNRRYGFVENGAAGPVSQIGGTADALNDYRVSGDGQTVVGYYQPGTPDRLPARWRAATGMQVLSGLESRAGMTQCVSGNGAVAAGWLRTTNGSSEEAFVWREGTGATVLPKFSASLPRSGVNDMTADTNTLVGACQTGSSSDLAVRWTLSGGVWTLQSLGALRPGSTFSFATCTSADGSVIGGAWGGGAQGEEAMVWTAARGEETLNQFAAAAGLDLSGWFFQRIQDVSADGNTFCCVGIRNNVGYGVVVTVPGPGVVGGMAVGVAGLAVRRRRTLRLPSCG